MASKNERAAEARAKAQAQVKNKERRTTVIIIAASLAVIAIFAGIVYFIVQSSQVPPLNEANAPAVADETGGIPVGATGVAGEGLTDGAVRVDLYIDLLCPVCNQFEQTNAADLDELREAGKINVYYHPIAILDRYSAGTAYPTRAANAVAVVADQSPEHVVPFIQALFANQPEENTAGLDDTTIAAIAVGAGVPTEVAESFKDGKFTKWVKAATQQASVDGMQGTPTVMIDREILSDPNINYFQAGVLKAHLEELAGK